MRTLLRWWSARKYLSDSIWCSMKRCAPELLFGSREFASARLLPRLARDAPLGTPRYRAPGNPQARAQPALHGGWDHVDERAAERGDLAHQARTQIGVRSGRHHEDRFQAGIELTVHPRHLQFVLIVADRADAAQDSLRPPAARVVHQQALKRLHSDVRPLPGALDQHLPPLFHGEQRRLFRVPQDGHNQLVEYLRAPLNQIEVAVGRRIKRSWIDRYDSQCPSAKAEPILSLCAEAKQLPRGFRCRHSAVPKAGAAKPVENKNIGPAEIAIHIRQSRRLKHQYQRKNNYPTLTKRRSGWGHPQIIFRSTNHFRFTTSWARRLWRQRPRAAKPAGARTALRPRRGPVPGICALSARSSPRCP